LETDGRFDVKSHPLSTLENLDLLSGSTVFFTVELQRSLLHETTPAEFAGLQKIAQTAQSIFWLTSGSFLDANEPHSALPLGLSRALILEQPATKFFVINLETQETTEQSMNTCADLIHILDCSLADARIDLELVQKDGIFYSSRFVPDPTYNDEFRIKQQRDIIEVEAGQVHSCELACSKRGDLDSLYWKELVSDATDVRYGLEIDVKAYGLNFKVRFYNAQPRTI
jgi:hypothetical protein